MNRYVRCAFVTAVITFFIAACVGSGFAQGAPQKAPPSYVADPAVYKLIAENDQYVVVMAKRPVGHKDVWHSHLAQQATYMLTDCRSRAYTPDGKTAEVIQKKGTVTFRSEAMPSHSLENIGKKECEQLIIEHK